MMNGTRMPPSHTSPLTPRSGVLSEPLPCVGPPLSVWKTTSVLLGLAVLRERRHHLPDGVVHRR